MYESSPGVMSYKPSISACEKKQQWKEDTDPKQEKRYSTLLPDVVRYNAGFGVSYKAGADECAKNQL